MKEGHVEHGRAAAAVLAAAILLIAGCGKGDGEPPAPAPPAAPSPPERVAIAPQPPVSVPADDLEADPDLERVRGFTREFFQGDLASLHARFSPQMKETFPLERLQAFRKQVEERYGKEVEFIREHREVKGEYKGFVRWARFDKYDGVMAIQWIVKKDGTIGGFFIRPAEK